MQWASPPRASHLMRHHNELFCGPWGESRSTAGIYLAAWKSWEWLIIYCIYLCILTSISSIIIKLQSHDGVSLAGFWLCLPVQHAACRGNWGGGRAAEEVGVLWSSHLYMSVVITLKKWVCVPGEGCEWYIKHAEWYMPDERWSFNEARVQSEWE